MSGLTDSEREEIYARTMETWGVDSQVKMAIEEMSELTQALCKTWRDVAAENPEEVVADIREKLADVINMSAQLARMYGEEEVSRIRDEKLMRLRERIKSEEEK